MPASLLKFWGVRGSYSVPGSSTVKYGGNTSCVTIEKEVDGKVIFLMFDMGNGCIRASEYYMSLLAQKKACTNIPVFFTHHHDDHVQGFSFFTPCYVEACTMLFAGMLSLKKHIGNILESRMLPPNHPVEYSGLKSTRKHFVVKDGQTIYIGRDGTHQDNPKDAVFKIVAMIALPANHPQQGATYYKVTDIENGATVACIWDHESHVGGDQRVINFARGAHFMIHDAQYTEEEYNSSKICVQGYGHSTFSMAIENCHKAGVPSLAFFHYNPKHSDEKLDRIAHGQEENVATTAVVKNIIFPSEFTVISSDEIIAMSDVSHTIINDQYKVD